MSRGAIIERYVELQAMLTQHGVTAYTRRLFGDLAQLIARDYDGVMPWDEAFDAIMEELHREAFDPKRSPTRLVIEVANPVES